MRAVVAGTYPILAEGTAHLRLAPDSLLLEAVKPPELGEGIVVRVLNPSDRDEVATLHLARPPSACQSLRLDEHPAEHGVTLTDGTVTFAIPAHALRTVLLRF